MASPPWQQSANEDWTRGPDNNHHEARRPGRRFEYRLEYGSVEQHLTERAELLEWPSTESPVHAAADARKWLIAERGADPDTVWVIVWDPWPFYRPDMLRNASGNPHHALAVRGPLCQSSGLAATVTAAFMHRLQAAHHKGRTEVYASRLVEMLRGYDEVEDPYAEASRLTGVPVDVVREVTDSQFSHRGYPGATDE